MGKISMKGSILLAPVPSVFITSKNTDGKTNVFTVGWIGVACTRPPMITVAIRPERLSYEYIKNTGEFVINLPNRDMVKALDYCGVKSGRTSNKFEDMNLGVEDCSKVSVPMIKKSPVTLECKVKNITPLGSHDLFLAEIVQVNVEESIIDLKGKIHLEKADLVAYSHGEYFSLEKDILGTFGFSVRKKSKPRNKK
ncbi:flavin reductase family protein [Clostridium sp. 19966]|uniref:flavin reductase family protein n=1 Tax=Clostridium sp. 19966 TaxID=2768166 RepID=UPI0028DF1600|nr:flavin reductase family protein [Clostridium sp. 19966]MDT8716288.1 flavin reductase family protein [Clostridium sp. 19966]